MAVVILVVLRPQALDVPRVAQPPQGLAELVEGDLAVAVPVDDLTPGREHGAKPPHTQALELLDGVDEDLLVLVRLAGLGKFLPPRHLPGLPNLEEPAGLLPLHEGPLQRRLSGLVRLLAEHAVVSAAECEERLRVEVLEREELPREVRLHQPEELLGAAGDAQLLARPRKLGLVDDAGTLLVHLLQPGQQHVPVNLLAASLQLRERGIQVRVEVLQRDLAIAALVQLLPQAQGVCLVAEALHGLAELAEGNSAVAIEVEGLSPSAKHGPTSRDKGRLEALYGVHA
mmetsp:Transcript_77377/g.241143  ORF Transcript_77377/g.241143 Transcript_77377/m.241143 type:complete len:286 (-) Transcript_77377:15-872(-)